MNNNLAINQPTSGDLLSSPDHSLSHRVFANDSSAAVKAVVVDSSNNVFVGDGGTTNYTKFDSGGFPTLYGTAQGGLNLRPNLIQKASKQLGTPTEVYRGCNVGYSFPVWNSNDEELYFRMRIPARWDGTTDPQFGIMTTITAGEDVGDKFKFQLEWQTTSCGGTAVMGTTTSNVVSEQTIITGGAAANTAYCLWLTLDASDATNPIQAGEMLQGRLRRIASDTPAVTNEISVWDWAVVWKTRNVFGTWSVQSNVT